MGHCSSAAMTLVLAVLILFYFIVLIYFLGGFEKMSLQTQLKQISKIFPDLFTKRSPL